MVLLCMSMGCEMIAAGTPSSVTFQSFGHIWIEIQISTFVIVVSGDAWKSGPERATSFRRPRGLPDAITQVEIVSVMLRQKVSDFLASKQGRVE
jgi:hypothetical protein